MTDATALIDATNLSCSLTCKDLEASIRFYRDAIGFAVADRLSYNAPGRPRGVTVTETALLQGGDVLETPPLSVVLHVLPVR